MRIRDWLKQANTSLQDAGSTSARLDAELILTHTLKKGRTHIHAHGDDAIDSRYLDILDTRLALRLDRVPLAYIIGHKEFYGRSFKVTPSTLIPRPESEAIITLLKSIARQPELPLSSDAPQLVDVGTGSGCLGITAKLELPELTVTLLDTSRHALTVAEENARRLGANVTVLKSDLLSAYPFAARYIVANLPYVDEAWEVSPELRHEPKEALFAANEGLALIYRLFEEAPSRLSPRGYLFIEADLRQHQAIKARAKDHGFSAYTEEGLILVFRS